MSADFLPFGTRVTIKAGTLVGLTGVVFDPKNRANGSRFLATPPGFCWVLVDAHADPVLLGREEIELVCEPDKPS